MRNIKYALHSVAALAVASLTACSNDDGMEENPSGIQKTVTLTAWQPGSESQTRVGFDSNGKAYWQEGDAIGVIPSSGNTFSSFSITSGAGTGKATFSGEVTGGVGQYAVYPYNLKCRLVGNTLRYNLPESYTYDSVDQTFFPEDKDGKTFNMPMLGTIADGKVTFKYLGGVICLLIDKMPAASGTVTVTESTNQLCGRINTSVTDDTPELKTSASTSDNAVRFNYSNATEGNPGVFYLPVATGTYNLTVKVEGNGKTSTTAIDVAEITRTKLQALKVTTNYDGGSTFIVINGHNFVDLGLPSGLLWAETNIGAKTAADDGDYFAWGETEPKESYSWSNYLWNVSESEEFADDDIIKYNDSDGLNTLDAEDDAATANWGSGCRMPTYSEFNELVDTDNCTWTITTRTTADGSTTIGGYEVRSAKNGNTIFLPASGRRDNDYKDFGTTAYGAIGIYMTSTAGDMDKCRMPYHFKLSLKGDFYLADMDSRCWGYTVRPVAEPQDNNE